MKLILSSTFVKLNKINLYQIIRQNGALMLLHLSLCYAIYCCLFLSNEICNSLRGRFIWDKFKVPPPPHTSMTILVKSKMIKTSYSRLLPEKGHHWKMFALRKKNQFSSFSYACSYKKKTSVTMEDNTLTWRIV